MDAANGLTDEDIVPDILGRRHRLQGVAQHPRPLGCVARQQSSPPRPKIARCTHDGSERRRGRSSFQPRLGA